MCLSVQGMSPFFFFILLCVNHQNPRLMKIDNFSLRRFRQCSMIFSSIRAFSPINSQLASVFLKNDDLYTLVWSGFNYIFLLFLLVFLSFSNGCMMAQGRAFGWLRVSELKKKKYYHKLAKQLLPFFFLVKETCVASKKWVFSFFWVIKTGGIMK